MGFGMAKKLTPQQVEDAAVKARKPLYKFLQDAGVTPPTFYNWKSGRNDIRPLTRGKLADAVDAV